MHTVEPNSISFNSIGLQRLEMGPKLRKLLLFPSTADVSYYLTSPNLASFSLFRALVALKDFIKKGQFCAFDIVS